MLPRLVRRVTSNTRILLVVVLTAALVITVAGYAIGRGLGATSVPSGDVAVVDDVPDGGITTDEFQKTLEQTAARQGIKQVPKPSDPSYPRSEEHTSELQSHHDLVCRLLLEKKKKKKK